MTDKTASERLQPSLLDRLTDDNPSERTESRDSNVIDLRELRTIVQRDLVWLLNTSDNGNLMDAERYPSVYRSVLNYGIKEVAGDYSTEERAEMIRKSIRAAIMIYEPRIHSGSIDVQLRIGKDANASLITFDIRAEMWAQPLPMELYLRSEVDVTTGELALERMN